jgi:hypothetical protein
VVSADDVRLKDILRPRSSHETFLEDSLVSERSGGGGGRGGSLGGIDDKEGLWSDVWLLLQPLERDDKDGLGSDVWMLFEPLEMADVRTDSQGLLAIIRRAMLGEDGEL